MTIGEIAVQWATSGECEQTNFAFGGIRYVPHTSAYKHPASCTKDFQHPAVDDASLAESGFHMTYKGGVSSIENSGELFPLIGSQVNANLCSVFTGKAKVNSEKA